MALLFATPFRATTEFFQAGYAYGLFMWGIYLLYCIGEQVHRGMVYLRRRRLTNGKDVAPLKVLPGWQRVFKRKVVIPFITDCISIMEICHIVALLAINLIFIFFAPFTLSGNYMLPVADVSNRRCAYVGLVNFTIAFIMVTRNSIFSKLSSHSFDELVPYHRWYTRIGLAEQGVHIGYQIWKAYNRYGNVKDSLFYNFEIQTGTIATLGYIILYITSFETIRRRYFEFFYYSHVFGILLSTAGALAHEYGDMAILAPGVFLWLADRCFRYYNSHYQKTVTVAVEANEKQTFTRILFKKEGLEKSFIPGQYVFVAIRQSKGFRRMFESLNWHPFTISEIMTESSQQQQEKNLETGKVNEVVDGLQDEKSPTNVSSSHTPTLSSQNDSDDTAVSSGFASIHIKGIGNMTKRLFSSSQVKGEQVQLKVDGPFGANSLYFQDYETVVLISAGVGVTPSLTILKDLVEKRSKGYATVRTKTIHFVWSIREIEHAEAFVSILKACRDIAAVSIQPLDVKFEIYLSASHDNGSEIFKDLGNSLTLHNKRAIVNEVMTDIAMQHTVERVAVQTCGPADFMREVENISSANGWSVRAETFQF
ncbi:ferric reductase NAD binding domain-containing protein [Umbelopsis sp. AD052]|nr:ferric reductase NAD binding domain-containing protein [Umbelopsis sp. AD052]